MKKENQLEENLKELQADLDKLSKDSAIISGFKEITEICSDALVSGNTLYFAGNGGSAAEAQHIAAEFVGRFKLERDGYPAIALTTDTSVITAIANDYSFDEIFSRQVQALVRKKDVVFLLSTSGNSKNLIKACVEAKKNDAICIALLGKNGGLLKQVCDLSITIPSKSTARIQEFHLFLLHTLCEILELRLSNMGLNL